MAFSLFVYSSLTLIMYYLGKEYERKQNIKWILLICFAYAAVMGTRYGVGVDHLRYLETYENWGFIRYGSYMRYEIGFVALYSFFYDIGAPVYICHGAISFFIMFAFLFGYRKFPAIIPYISVMFMITMIGITGCTNGMRQYIAAAFFLLILPCFYNRKPLLYFVGVTLAILFHNSAVVLIPIFFLTYVNEKIVEKRYFSIIAVVLLISAILLRVVIGQDVWSFVDRLLLIFDLDMYEIYLTSEYMLVTQSWGLFRSLLLVFNIILIISIPNMVFYFDKLNINIRKLSLLFVVGLLAYYLFEGSLALTRMILYLTILEVPFYSFFAYYVFKRKRVYIPILVVVLMFSYINTIAHGSQNSARYVNYFQKSEWANKERELMQ